jgi:hypothetical protein
MVWLLTDCFNTMTKIYHKLPLIANSGLEIRIRDPGNRMAVGDPVTE